MNSTQTRIDEMDQALDYDVADLDKRLDQLDTELKKVLGIRRKGGVIEQLHTLLSDATPLLNALSEAKATQQQRDQIKANAADLVKVGDKLVATEIALHHVAVRAAVVLQEAAQMLEDIQRDHIDDITRVFIRVENEAQAAGHSDLEAAVIEMRNGFVQRRDEARKQAQQDSAKSHGVANVGSSILNRVKALQRRTVDDE